MKRLTEIKNVKSLAEAVNKVCSEDYIATEGDFKIKQAIVFEINNSLEINIKLLTESRNKKIEEEEKIKKESQERKLYEELKKKFE